MTALPGEAASLESRVAAQLVGLESLCVAVSGGVDSSVVLALAARALGCDRVLAATATAPVMIEGEGDAARRVAAALGVAHVTIPVALLEEPLFAVNPRERCYVCKGMIVDAVRLAAAERAVACVADGANADDIGDERPGMRAADERGVRHPLLAAGLGKSDVRLLATALGLETAEAPSQACLASRIPYGEAITRDKLEAVAAAESVLHELGFRQCRVRHHGPVARVEVLPEEVGRAAGAVREEIVRRLRALGFTYVTVDLDGFRSGSMNEVWCEPQGGHDEPTDDESPVVR